MNNNLKGELAVMDSLGIKPNYTALGKKYGMDPRTVKKIYKKPAFIRFLWGDKWWISPPEEPPIGRADIRWYTLKEGGIGLPRLRLIAGEYDEQAWEQADRVIIFNRQERIGEGQIIHEGKE